MAILRAYALPHPKLAIPAVGRGEEKQIAKTIAAFDVVAQDIAMVCPDTIIFLTPHGVIYDDYFHISPGDSAKGNCERFGTRHVKLNIKYDPNFAAVLSHTSTKYGVSAKTLGERNAPLDHGVMVPLWYINRRYNKFKALRISPSNLDESAHYRMGQCISEAALNAGRRAVVVASGNLSRKFDENEHGYVQEALEFDKEMAYIFATGTFSRLLAIPPSLRESANECGYMVFAMLAGCLDRRVVGAELLSYENPFGEGYAVATFSPGHYDENRNFLEMSQKAIPERKIHAIEDTHCALARRALEYSLRHRHTMPIPMGLPKDMLNSRAGVAVTLYVDGELRGAAGSLEPTTDNIATEIIQNAVAAGLDDLRFPPVTESELMDLVYKVDIYGVTENIYSPDQLDINRHGVVVICGDQWGVQLPNEYGIETGEQQIAAAWKKSGIAPGVPFKLERFEVERHG